MADSELKGRLRADLTTAMKARDAVTTGTLRMVLAALTTAEVAGAEAKDLTDAEVVAVLTKEVKKRHEAAAIYRDAARAELADKETAEAAVIEQYLPAQLSDSDLAALVAEVIDAQAAADGAAPTMKQMGLVIKAVKEKAGVAADGTRVAAAVKTALSS